MKFGSLVASTLLIVLISQHSSTALPINESTTEEPCLEGFERIDGHCVEIKSKLHLDQVESSSPLVEPIPISNVKVILQADEPKKFGACPKGMVRGEHGICKEVISQDQPAITVEPTHDHEEALEVTDKPSDVTVETLDATGEPFEVTEEPFGVTSEALETTEEPFDVTSEAWKTTEETFDVTHEPSEVTEESFDVTGEPLEVTEEPSEVTGEPLEVTSEKSDAHDNDDENAKDTIRKSGSIEVPKGCPRGTKADEDGACQDIKQTSTKKTFTDLKILLKGDGSCPDSMKKINGRCMYVRSKAMAKINQNFATINDDDLAASRTRAATEKNGEYQLVPVLSDNSCPTGTEYSEYGLCRKRLRPSSFSTDEVTKPECLKDQVFVAGRCILKKVKVLLPTDITTRVSKTSTTTRETEQAEDDESPKSTPKLTIIKETPEDA